MQPIYQLAMIPYYPSFKKPNLSQRCLPFLGLDDFAFRKGHTYGTMICDLQTHKPLALLPDRRPETVTAWLEKHPIIKLVSRDGFTAFRQAITEANSSILQIYDRFHFVRNAKKQLDSSISSIAPATITWSLSSESPIDIPLTRAESKIQERQNQKWELIQKIKKAFEKGKNISRLARDYELDRRTIYKYIKMKEPPNHKRQRSQLTEPYKERMTILEKNGNTVKEIYEIIEKEGYIGTFSGVRTFIERLRRDRKQNLSREETISISRRSLCAWLWQWPSKLTKEQTEYLHRILHNYPELKTIYQCIQHFRFAIETRKEEDLLQWVKDQLISRKNPFYYYAFRLRSDIQAVKNALTFPFSNGLLEGQINRLKTIKRMTYGRAGLALMEKRVLFQW